MSLRLERDCPPPGRRKRYPAERTDEQQNGCWANLARAYEEERSFNETMETFDAPESAEKS